MGFAEGRVVNSPCCGIPVPMVVALFAARVPSFDVEFGDDISEDMFSDCVIYASNSLLLPCCGNRHRSTLVASFAIFRSVRAPVRSQFPPLSLSLVHLDSLASLRCRLIGTSMFSRR